ncbi:MAG: SURF4 family-domain-containing protein [Benjaminiella poitrasii]|nr:MAG: SURF4 family-domain-containing protein [Benjaminiella poitrasii]
MKRLSIKLSAEDLTTLNAQSLFRTYLPIISRFLIISTFYEDGLRILYQWRHQMAYLQTIRYISKPIASLLLSFNATSMLSFSTCILFDRHVKFSVATLTCVIISQAISYDLIFDTVYLLRNLSITGGLLLCLADSIVRRRALTKRARMFASLPQQIKQLEGHKYIQCAGRTLLVLLFLGFVWDGQFRGSLGLIGLTACGMVTVGYRVRWSATLLVSLLCITNVLVHDWWGESSSSIQRDFLRYDFFQCLSIIGGLLLLLSIGPGQFSYDEKERKIK